jgi:protein-disulfide isomerase
VKEWKEIAAGRPSSFAKSDGTALEKNLLLARRLELTTTPSIVYKDGHVSTGMLSSVEIASRISKSAMR